MEQYHKVLPAGVRVYEGYNAGLPLRAWYVQVDEKDPGITTRVVVSEDEDRRESATSFANALGACVVVNGGYFRMDLMPAQHVGLLMMDGIIVEPPTWSVLREEVRFHLARAALGFHRDGTIDVAWVVQRGDTLMEMVQPPNNRPGVPETSIDAKAILPWPMRDALAAGPCLISDGAIHITANEEVF
ncbi:MAG: hypothetical protein JSW54_04140, partial [Fidelibacterota bacterium]